jgi:hypothetical protein
MVFTLQTLTLDQRIAQTVPTNKYDCELEPILADEVSGWKNGVLKSNDTLYDYDLMKARALLKEKEQELAAASTLLKKLTADLAEKIKNKKFAPMINGMKASISTAESDVYMLTPMIPQLKLDVKRLEALRDITLLQLRSLRNVVSQYKSNRDLEFLKRGIHCVAEIACEKMVVYQKI